MGKSGQERPVDEGKRDFIVLNTKGWLGGTIRLLPPLRRCIWIDLLAMSREGRFPGYVAMGKEGGKLVGWPIKRLAGKLGYNYQAFKQALDEFVSQDRIVMDEARAIRIVNWDKYQFIPSYGCERSDEDGVKTGDGITPGSSPPSSPASPLFEPQAVGNRQDSSPNTILQQNKPQPARALEDWDEDVEDEKGTVCSADIRRAVRYIRSPQCGLTWYKANLSASLIRSRAREMVESVPEGWGLPRPSRQKPVAGKGCDDCGETGWKCDGVPCPGCSASHDAPASPLAPPTPRPAPPPVEDAEDDLDLDPSQGVVEKRADARSRFDEEFDRDMADLAAMSKETHAKAST